MPQVQCKLCRVLFVRKRISKGNLICHKCAIQIHRTDLRKQIIKGYGGRCECCGESNPLFLTIDHINNDGKDDPNRRNLYRYLIINGFPNHNYQLLCYNCNLGKHRNKGICPHIQKNVIF